MTAPAPHEQRWARPGAGREPAAAALLGWQAGHGTRPGTVPERRVHAFAPLTGLGVRPGPGTTFSPSAGRLGV
ncbi:hypothetical protein [Streptomyces sp. ALI-76-A]|uniref:hypothetical protein n=1 Tax=Streptomyces sp. ALI-76-A TaxID=3025736 RepID=UPI00256EAC30|nr:hypothetical protein [Streptomyces sp. ALI-76-A]MDL5203093.1 hypothetical protein [Streptomyces sp. ALI-76-A]